MAPSVQIFPVNGRVNGVFLSYKVRGIKCCFISTAHILFTRETVMHKSLSVLLGSVMTFGSALSAQTVELQFWQGKPQDRTYISERLRTVDGPRSQDRNLDQHFLIAYVDINNDGRMDMLARVTSPTACIENSCETRLYIAQSDGHWKQVAFFMADRVEVQEPTSRSYHDIVAIARDPAKTQYFRWAGWYYREFEPMRIAEGQQGLLSNQRP
jgi:hypothetical protein